MGSAGGMRIATRQTITAEKLMPLIRKQVPSPTKASTTPATAGPTTRAALKTAEFSEMALIRSSLEVIWMTSAWRPGISKALMMPSNPASVSTCQTWMRPESVRAASTKACSIDSVWVTMTTFWREKRSAGQAAERAEGEDGDLGAEPGGAEQQFGVGEAVDQPALGHILHPGADQGDDLPGEEEAEIAVAQGAEGMGNAAGE